MLAGWLKEALAASGLGQAEVARQLTAQLGRSIDRAAVNKMTKGERRIAADELLAIEAITGRRAPSTETQTGWQVPVRGLVGAGGTIDTSSEQLEHEPLFEVSVPFPVPEDALAFQIRGDSMWPRYDSGDVIVCGRFAEPPDGTLGFVAAVETSDGARYLKRVLRGSRDGLFHLESHNAPMMVDVHVVKFSAVIAVIPATQVHQVTREARQSVAKQIREKKPLRA